MLVRLPTDARGAARRMFARWVPCAGTGVCCPCIPPMPPLPPCVDPDSCTNLSSARGYGVGLGMNELLVYAGGFKGNAGLSSIDVAKQRAATCS